MRGERKEAERRILRMAQRSNYLVREEKKKNSCGE
jgi:hypothetical protein